MSNIVSKTTKLIDNFQPYFSWIVTFSIAFCLAFLPIWQLTILAGFIGGLFHNYMKKGALTGAIGTSVAWIIFSIIQILNSNVEVFFNQLSGIIIGQTNLGWIFILAVIIIAFILGVLSGALGSGVRIFVNEYLMRDNNK